ncbi:hypothetical protein [Clostridium tertium]|uniref:hypothetical protein n=1 Tax=Clostridium tertium TaxID=1559 RepID=UPI0023B31CC6|nr:hypothetical protein [Clostridium tertium]
MKFFHASISFDEMVLQFIPRIPKNPLRTEEVETPRISVSDSISGCLSATAWGGKDLDTTYQSYSDPYDNTKEVNGVMVRIYVIDHDLDDNTISPRYLFENGLVDDAKMTREYWITDKCIPSTVYDILITEWDEESYDYLSYYQESLIEEGEEYEDVWQGGVWTKITDIKYSVIKEYHLEEYCEDRMRAPYILEICNEQCSKNTKSLEDIAAIIRENVEPSSWDSGLINHLNNGYGEFNIISPLLMDLSHLMHASRNTDISEEYMTTVIYRPKIQNLIDVISLKYSYQLCYETIKEGSDRIIFVFDKFVVKADKNIYSRKTENEYSEYYNILRSMLYNNKKSYKILPYITYMIVNDILFSIFPRAKIDTWLKLSPEWVHEQITLRYELLGEKICLDSGYGILSGKDTGYYGNELYIIDSGAIKSIQEEVC